MAIFVTTPLNETVAQWARTPTVVAAQPNSVSSQWSRTPITVRPAETSAQWSRSVIVPTPLNVVIPITSQIIVSPDGAKYRLLIFDTNGNMTAACQDMLTGTFEDIVNGGSGQATIELPRRFVDLGWIGPAYRVQFFLDDGLGDPWFDGRVSEIDQNQDMSGDYESITVHAEGWHTALNDAILDGVNLAPGVQPNGVDNGSMNADVFLSTLISQFMDSSKFAPAFIASMPIGLDKLTFDGTGLSDAIDQIVQQVLSNTGQLFEWWVRGQVANGGKPAIVIQPQSNPSQVMTNYYSPSNQLITQFLTKVKDSDIYSYQIQNSSRDLFNMIALYGGTDPNTGLQVYGAFKDSTSISLYGLRQKKVTNTSLVSTQSLSNYATAYLLLNAYPQPQGSFKLFRATDFARAGQWFQIYEGGLTQTNGNPLWIVGANQQLGEHPPNLKQMRSVRVVTSIQKADRIEQEVFVTAPRPYIDNDYYAALGAATTKAAGSSAITSISVLRKLFVQNGGEYVSNT